MSDTKDILFLEPVFTSNVWGGTRLREDFGYPAGKGNTGECWGVSAYSDRECRIRRGRYKGKTLSQLWIEAPELFGCPGEEKFPLLTKLIDAREDLSIQVHPDDTYAREHEAGNCGKTECWYVIDCEENATVILGHHAESREELKRMIEEKRFKDLFEEVSVKKGDVILIEPGTVHAVQGGMLILETQQSSDITYRVYDYDRFYEGRPRELHQRQCMDVITVPAKKRKDMLTHSGKPQWDHIRKLMGCAYFTMYKIDVREEVIFDNNGKFLIMSVLDGHGELNGEPLKKGDHLILPSGFEGAALRGRLQIVASRPVDKNCEKESGA